MPRRPTTRRGEKTRRKLLEKAAKAFIKYGFHGTSVSRICREAGVANGSYYQYFTDKIEVFSALVQRMREGFAETVSEADTPAAACRRIFDFFEIHGAAFQVFREAEFLDVAHPRESFYDGAVARIRELVDLDEATAWSLFGAQTMPCLHFGIWDGRSIPDDLRESFISVVQQGIALGRIDRWSDVTLPKMAAPEAALEGSTKGERTRRALLDAARREFAGRGYAASRIMHVTEGAGTALGTFYVHFPSKRAALVELVDEIRKELLISVGRVAGGVRHRLELERRAFLSFLDYLTRHREIYSIVRQAEFAEPDVGRGYYRTIIADYAARLTEAMEAGQVRRLNPEVTACFVMGAQAHAGMRFILWESGKRPPAKAVRATLKLIMNGL